MAFDTFFGRFLVGFVVAIVANTLNVAFNPLSSVTLMKTFSALLDHRLTNQGETWLNARSVKFVLSRWKHHVLHAIWQGKYVVVPFGRVTRVGVLREAVEPLKMVVSLTIARQAKFASGIDRFHNFFCDSVR